MEEKQSILALGAGASTKFVMNDRIERAENVKDIKNYIERIDEMIERKKQGYCDYEKTGYNIIQFSLSKELQHGMMVSILAGELARKADCQKNSATNCRSQDFCMTSGNLRWQNMCIRKDRSRLRLRRSSM